MNKADEIRDKIRQMRYLAEEKKFIDDLIQKLEEQKNRLLLEDISIKRLIESQSNTELNEEEEVMDQSAQEVDNNYLYSGTPCRAIEEPIVNCLEINDGVKKPKAVVEAIDLDVRRVLLKLASGGHHHQLQQQEEEEEDDED